MTPDTVCDEFTIISEKKLWLMLLSLTTAYAPDIERYLPNQQVIGEKI